MATSHSTDRPKVAPIDQSKPRETITFLNRPAEAMTPDTAIHSLHALFQAIDTILNTGESGPGDIEDARLAGGLAVVGTYLSAQLSSRV